VSGPYIGREQTAAKHFILKGYLQALSFKVLRGWDITYIDGFSGPWESQTEDFRDTSFMIAIEVLKDAQQRIFESTGVRRRIRCFFSEVNTDAYKVLAKAVAPYHCAQENFEIVTFQGEFENAVPAIKKAIGSVFPLIFIDPTGWTGYAFQKIKSIFESPKCEVLINFMYDFINRFVASQDEAIIATMDPILGGPGWRDRLDKSLALGVAVEKLFRETLKVAGQFAYVVSTKIDKNTADRPHFFLAYGTKSRAGLKAFRQSEYDALKLHARNRANAKEKRNEARASMGGLFPGHEADVQEAGIDEIVVAQKALATAELIGHLELGPRSFADIVDKLLQPFMLRETNVKDICVELARAGKLENTWGGGNRKPQESDVIRLKQ
jgi:three-Cys-motif partner protein